MEDKNIKNQDLGLGDLVIQQNKSRFLNRDGSFNVHRKGMFDRGSFSPYHAVLSSSWGRFYWGVLAYYLIANLIFSALYFMSGKTAFPEIANMDAGHRFGQLFFYSVQVITTLGTSPLHPANVRADIVLAIEAMVGMLGFALGASLMFARFSNPATNILFSGKSVIAPYQEAKGFMIRIINGRSNELVDVTATLTLAMDSGDGKRSFQVLPLERDSVLVFPLNWTIVHPITPDSPIYNLKLKDLEKKNAEFLLSITAVDQDLSKTVYARSSYKAEDMVEGKFVNIIERDSSGTVVVDPARIGEIEEVLS